MLNEFTQTVVSLQPLTIASNATQEMTFDTKGHDSLKVHVCSGTSATTSALFTTLKFAESDTVTNASSQTDIVALTGGTATSASVGFVFPLSLADQSGGGIVQFEIDLRKRKRFVGLLITSGQTGGHIIGAVGEMYRSAESADTVAQKFLSNLESTTNTSISKIVRAL